MNESSQQRGHGEFYLTVDAELWKKFNMVKQIGENCQTWNLMDGMEE